MNAPVLSALHSHKQQKNSSVFSSCGDTVVSFRSPEVVSCFCPLISHNIKDQLPHFVKVPLVLPKQLWPIKACTPQDLLRCLVVSGTKKLAADPLSPVSCEAGHPQIRFLFLSHSTDGHQIPQISIQLTKAIPCPLSCFSNNRADLLLLCKG